MQRPLSIKMLSALLLVLALLAAIGAIFVLRQTASKEVLAETDAAKVVMALRWGAALLGTFAVIEALFAVCLWHRSPMVWWLSVALHSIAVILLAYDAATASSRDVEDIVFPIVAAVLVALHFLPGVRSWVRQSAVVAVVSNP